MKPILFSTPMVQAILAGRKTQTRRIIKFAGGCTGRSPMMDVTDPNRALIFSPTGIKRSPYSIGDVLWVRETWAHPSQGEIANGAPEDLVVYKADIPLLPCAYDTWRPSIFMPREAARLFLRVTDVRAERVQDISQGDMIAEGVWSGCTDCFQHGGCCLPDVCNYVQKSFIELWDSLNAKRGYGWDTNPWVWVISFERHEPAMEDKP